MYMRMNEKIVISANFMLIATISFIGGPNYDCIVKVILGMFFSFQIIIMEVGLRVYTHLTNPNQTFLVVMLRHTFGSFD